jgi:hypothetical protein
MSLFGRLVAVVADDIITEYRKLRPPPADDDPAYLPSVTSATTERAGSWDHDKRAPAVAAQQPPFGFRGES